MIPILLLAFIAGCAIFAPILAPTNPYDLAIVSIMDSRLAPGEVMFNGTVAWLGTDGAGRDVLSAIIYGLRTSFDCSLNKWSNCFNCWACCGINSCFFTEEKLMHFLMRIVDIQLSFPAILIALVLLALLGKGVDKVIIALAIVQWALYARTVRATAIVERRKEYIEAATTLGLNNFRIIVKHLLPNSISPLIVFSYASNSSLNFNRSNTQLSWCRRSYHRAIPRIFNFKWF